MTSSLPNWKRGWRHGVGSVILAVIALMVTSGWFAIEPATAEPIGDEIAFVSRINDARTAIAELNEKDFGGRPLTVNEAKPREDRGSGGGRGGYSSRR